MHDKSIPKDITTHAYRGSTTSEKLSVLDSYPEKKLKTVVLQDGTNAIAKHSERSIEDLFEDYQKLVDKTNLSQADNNIILPRRWNRLYESLLASREASILHQQSDFAFLDVIFGQETSIFSKFRNFPPWNIGLTKTF